MYLLFMSMLQKIAEKLFYAVLKSGLFEAPCWMRRCRVAACSPALQAWVFRMFSGSLCFLPRFQPAAGLMERIQAIAQNVSDIAIKVDQILRNSLMNAKSECCPQVPSSSSSIHSLSWHPLPALSLCSGGWQEGPVRGAQGPQVP